MTSDTPAATERLRERLKTMTLSEIVAELQKRDEEKARLVEVLDSAVSFIEAAMVIAKRSCRDGDHLHYAWGERVCREARALGPLNALEALEQKARSARSTLKGEVND